MIAISGANGFLGKHCKIYCRMNKLKNVIFIDKKNYRNKITIDGLKNCKTFIHLAGINRSKKKNLIEKNTKILNYYLNILKNNKDLKKIIFTSSIHRKSKDDYGKSKLISEKELKKFCNNKKVSLKIIILSNIFGEFCKPNYNSVTATISDHLIKNKKFIIKKNKNLKLLYVKDVVENLFANISKNKTIEKNKYKTISVKNLYNKLYQYKKDYFNNVIPLFKDNFELYLFNTFRSYAFPNKIILKTRENIDNRGSLWEILKSDKNAHLFVSTTKKNKVRGNHYHSKKIERFFILEGSALIKFRYIHDNKVYKMNINSKSKCSVDIPTYCTHSLTNRLNKKLITVFFSNEIYNPNNSDTFYEKV